MKTLREETKQINFYLISYNSKLANKDHATKRDFLYVKSLKNELSNLIMKYALYENHYYLYEGFNFNRENEISFDHNSRKEIDRIIGSYIFCEYGTNWGVAVSKNNLGIIQNKTLERVKNTNKEIKSFFADESTMHQFLKSVFDNNFNTENKEEINQKIEKKKIQITNKFNTHIILCDSKEAEDTWYLPMILTGQNIFREPFEEKDLEINWIYLR